MGQVQIPSHPSEPVSHKPNSILSALFHNFKVKVAFWLMMKNIISTAIKIVHLASSMISFSSISSLSLSAALIPMKLYA